MMPPLGQEHSHGKTQYIPDDCMTVEKNKNNASCSVKKSQTAYKTVQQIMQQALRDYCPNVYPVERKDHI